jgi:hypothetical protein
MMNELGSRRDLPRFPAVMKFRRQPDVANMPDLPATPRPPVAIVTVAYSSRAGRGFRDAAAQANRTA